MDMEKLSNSPPFNSQQRRRVDERGNLGKEAIVFHCKRVAKQREKKEDGMPEPRRA